MKNNTAILTALISVAILFGLLGFTIGSNNSNETTNVIPPAVENVQRCTMEAKICPDGTAVGRSGPNCEFAPCSGAK